MSINKSAVTVKNISCTSSKPINVMCITNIFLHLESGYDLNANDDNLDNHKGEIAQSNSILLSLPVDQNYNNMIVYKMKMAVIAGILNVTDKKQ